MQRSNKSEREHKLEPAATAAEREWVERAITGDADAFARLYEVYVARVYRFVYFRVHQVQTAEDLTAQIFFKAWQSLNHYQWRGLPFGAWLFRIARNIIIDHHRTEKETKPLEAIELTQADPTSDMNDIVDQVFRAEELQSALEQLTDDQRQVVTLRFIEGMSTAETAEALGKHEGAIRALQMRALHAMAEILGARGVDEDGEAKENHDVDSAAPSDERTER